MKVVTIHQPNYIPWIGFFRKVSMADVFVILDTALFTKNGVIHRNKIRTREGWRWLTIPISSRYKGVPIKDVPLPEDRKWRSQHWSILRGNYGKTPYFEENMDFFEEMYENMPYKTLGELNEGVIRYLFDVFDIRPEIRRSSDMGIGEGLGKTGLNLEIVRKAGGDIYISGMGGKKYLEEEKFEECGITVRYFGFEPFEYPQRWPGFEPYMSAIDLLFNVGGKKGGELIKGV